MTKQAQTVNAIVLPTWTDSTSMIANLTSLVAIVLPLVEVVHPGFNPAPAVVQAWIAGVGLAVAGGAQIVNIIRHTILKKAAILGGLPVAVIGRGQHSMVNAEVTPTTPNPIAA